MVTDVSEFKYGAYECSDHNDNPLVFNTFDKVLAVNPGATPLFHSDRGYQYKSIMGKSTYEKHLLEVA